MQEMSLQEIKECELGLLKYMDGFCKKYRLRYYLAGGTLLGAIRHKGFIPWDDDIDVCMPRKDYLAFIEGFGNGHPFYKLKTSSKGNITAPFSKVVDSRTFIKDKFTNSDIDTNIWIDVFPVDGLPDDISEVRRIYQKANYYRKILKLTDANLGKGKTKVRMCIKYLLKPLANLYGKKRCVDNIEALAAKYPYDEHKYVGDIVWGLYGVGERMLKSEFEKAVEVEFEGHMFPTFSCWDSYLKGLYGDYMKLPPEEKRETHDMVAYRL